MSEFRIDASRLDPLEVWHAPAHAFDHGLGAAEGDGEVRGGHVELSSKPLHSSSEGSTKSVDALPWVSHRTDAIGNEFIEQLMVDGRKVLRFVLDHEGKTRECATKQRRHVNLIVMIDVAFIGKANRG